MKLSKRLEEIKNFIHKGNRLADIGTDHGLVPISLVMEQRIPKAIAMDLRKGPLEKAAAAIKINKLEDKIETRLSNGMEKLNKDEADTVLIAGMGGELMLNILDRANKKGDFFAEYVLSPQSEIDMFRKYLRKNGYLIINESMVEDEGKFYSIIKAVNFNFLGISGIESIIENKKILSFKLWDEELHNFYLALEDENFYAYLSKNTDELHKYDIYSYYLIQNRDKTLIKFLEKEYKKKIALYNDINDKESSKRVKEKLKKLQEEIELIEEIINETKN